MGDSRVTAIAAAVERVLADNGPMPEDQLLGALERAGVDLGEDPDETLSDVLDNDADLVMPLADQRWASVPALLLERVFTHRLDAREVEYDLLDVNPDLVALGILTESETYRHLADGSALIDVLAPFDADLLEERGVPSDAPAEGGSLLLAGGRLRKLGLEAGDLVGLRLTTAGLQLEAVDDSAAQSASADLGRCLTAILAADPGEPQQLDTAVWTACADDPALFRQTLVPLGQSLDQLGLPHVGDWLAGPGFDFGRWRLENRIQSIGERYGLSEGDALGVLSTVTMYERVLEWHDAALAAQEAEEAEEADEGPDVTTLARIYAEAGTPPVGGQAAAAQPDPAERALVRTVLQFLAEPAVAEAVLAETRTVDGHGAAALAVFAETFEPQAPRAARAALRWLRAKAYERLGDVTRAEASYRAAETLDPAWPLTLIDLARYASDRGDASRGLSLLRRAGAPPDHELIELLEQFEPKPRAELGRNQPCWCGSGRKYKQCHLHREQLPLAERAWWLYQKAGMFLLDGACREALIDATGERSRFSDAPDAFIEALQDALVTDSVLFEGGAFAGFVAERGGLLPDDERLLAEQWLLVERSVYEIQAVRPGEGIDVRDVRTGDAHHVRERSASRQLKAGDLVCARIVPAGDTMQIFGGAEPVALHQRDELIELLDSGPDPVELVAFLTRRFAPPTLQNTEGEPMVLCEAIILVPDPAVLTKSLDETYQREEAGAETDTEAAQWLEFVTTQGMRRIRATLRLLGEELRVQANSEARFERVLATVRTLEPSLTVLRESRQPAGDMRAAMSLAQGSPAGGQSTGKGLDPSDPDVAALLGQFAREYEQNWLDEPIPALAGRTPRECAADPTRRPDLIRLLDSFPPDDDLPGVMNPDRLRAALDLR